MLQVILQNALADRCKLVIHRIPTHINGFALVAANHGPNRKYLVESNSGDVILDKAVSIALDVPSGLRLSLQARSRIGATLTL
jgi:uncharacterized protein (TIGR03435 family)